MDVTLRLDCDHIGCDDEPESYFMYIRSLTSYGLCKSHAAEERIDYEYDIIFKEISHDEFVIAKILNK